MVSKVDPSNKLTQEMSEDEEALLKDLENVLEESDDDAQMKEEDGAN